MALAEAPFKMTMRGSWPGALTLRRNWARAEARPWNDAHPDASLRLVRGGGGFLGACAEHMFELGVPSVLSPPLPPTARNSWVAAGFEPDLDLALMRLSLEEQPSCPNHLVVDGEPLGRNALLDIDRAAFSDFWRFDINGLGEAIEATSNSDILIIRDQDGGAAGFAVVGFGSAIAYLQRVAVHPDWQGEGMGRSLVRAAARRARASGARVMLLNTQFDNEPAIELYTSEGFVLLPEALTLMRRHA